MKLKTPINENYAATVVTIGHTVPLENCDNVHHAIIFGNLVVVSKDTVAGQRGVFFPVETKLSPQYLHENNLYRDNTLNKNDKEKGYFEENGRIKCVKFRGNRSEGLFMPLESLSFAVTDVNKLDDGDTFDELDGIKICEKYVPRGAGSGLSSRKGERFAKKISRIVANQFRFHPDTSMLGKNIAHIKPETLLQISNKLHGTSFVAGRLLCKKKLGLGIRLLKGLDVPIVDTYYDQVYSSRKVIKNDDLNKEYNHFYGEDIWADISKDLESYILPGMTLYGEAVGFTKGGKAIQGKYDYGETVGNYGIYIYRITLTDPFGNVHEFSAKQVKDWCAQYGLKSVPEYFYGRAGELFPQMYSSLEAWQGEFLSYLLSTFNMEKDCELCKNKVPAEGIVLRVEGTGYEAYKLKSFRFRELETKLLDTGEVDIETEQSEDNENNSSNG